MIQFGAKRSPFSRFTLALVIRLYHVANTLARRLIDTHLAWLYNFTLGFSTLKGRVLTPKYHGKTA